MIEKKNLQRVTDHGDIDKWPDTKLDDYRVVTVGHGLVTGRVDYLRREMYYLVTAWSRPGSRQFSQQVPLLRLHDHVMATSAVKCQSLRSLRE